MSASGLSSKGSVFKIDGTTIGQVYSIGGPSMNKDNPETTDLSSDWRTFSPSGVRDGGDITLGLRWLPGETGHDDADGGLIYYLSGETFLSGSIVWSNGQEAKFTGSVTAFDVSADLDSPLDAQCTVKVIGALVWV